MVSAGQSTVQFFEEKEGLIRGVERGNYAFYNSSGELVLDLRGFKNAMDFNEGLAVVKGRGRNSYGAINRNGKLVIDTVWSFVRPSRHGFLLAARTIPGVIVEDRGNGYREYPNTAWYFVENKTGNVLDEITFKSVISTNGYASGEDHFGYTFFIDVTKLNPALYDPFMKAVKKINGHKVSAKLDKRLGLVHYKYLHNDKVALSYAYNQNPFSKYQVKWSGVAASAFED